MGAAATQRVVALHVEMYASSSLAQSLDLTLLVLTEHGRNVRARRGLFFSNRDLLDAAPPNFCA